MKNLFLIVLLYFSFLKGMSQQLYADFERGSVIGFVKSSGQLAMVPNAYPDKVNGSGHCAKYIRDTNYYDNILIYPDTILSNVLAYAGDAGLKISMKLYSTAPVGTTVLLQLGKKSDERYPSGVYCEFIHHTTVRNEWQNVVFGFYQTPEGSLASFNQVDKIVLLFDPGSHSRDTMYIDDLSGPELITEEEEAIATEAVAPNSIRLYQNSPNPVKNNTHINFQLKTSGLVSLELFDILGKPVISLINKKLKAGIYSIPVDTEAIPDGIYFYVLKTEDDSRSMRMIVSK